MKEPVPTVCTRFHKAVELIGGRWTGAIIQSLLNGPTRYATIRAAIPEISDRMLSDRLRILETEGLVERRVLPETPVRVEYLLTQKGKSLEPALGAIGSWAQQWIDAPDGAPATQNAPAAGGASPHAEQESRHITGKPRIKPRIPATP